MSLKGMIVVAFLACAAVGCSETECDKATDKLQECSLPSANTDGASCEGRDLCEADCLNTHSCDEIRAAVLNGAQNAYSACDDACN